MKRCHSRFSSVEAVSHCDELVNEILLRLPLDAVCKFKCVSKTWNSLISHPLFCSNYLSQRKNSLLPLLGFFRITLAAQDYGGSTLEVSFLQNCKERKFISLDIVVKRLFIDASPEGLILCRLERFTVFKYYICNPVTNQWFALPEPRHAPSSAGLSCEERSSKDGDGVVHFKVVAAIMEVEEGATHDRLHIETFSSRTGKWSESFLTCPSAFSYEVEMSYQCLSVGGMLYWKVSGHLVAYDPHMGENSIWLIELPPLCCKKREGFFMDYILGHSSSSDGCLLRFALNEKLMIKVWELKKKISSYSLSRVIPSSEWVLKEEVSHEKLGIGNSLPHICFIEFHPRNAKLVYLQRGSMVFCYDFGTGRSEQIQYHGNGTGTVSENDRLVPYFQPPWRPSLPCLP
ncbi:F-box protein At5g03970-like [Cornus florida]|uniref:F-box protein At5g03970-like n=1 Tax=Cornus florida TaxID=4283 RepID=UPI00289A650F|nr:F-box protein At5g03970-like [Cornus florida]